MLDVPQVILEANFRNDQVALNRVNREIWTKLWKMINIEQHHETKRIPVYNVRIILMIFYLNIICLMKEGGAIIKTETILELSRNISYTRKLTSLSLELFISVWN